MLDAMNSEDPYENNKFMLIATLPLSAFYVTYACALNGVPAQKHVKHLVERCLEVINSKSSGISYSDLCSSVLEEIEG